MGPLRQQHQSHVELRDNGGHSRNEHPLYDRLMDERRIEENSGVNHGGGISLECRIRLAVLRSQRKAAHAWCASPVYCHVRNRNTVYVVVPPDVLEKPPPVNPIGLAQWLQRMLHEGEVRNQTCLAARTGLTRSRITLASIPESQKTGKMSRMAPSWSQESEDRGQNANKR
jgi:hypothetical protein